MKRFLKFATIGLLISYCSAAQAADWISVTANAIGDKFFVDKSSIQRKGDSILYWEYREFQQPNNAFLEETVDQPVYGTVVQWSVNCETKNQRLRQVTAYNKNKKVIRKFVYGDAGSVAQPRPGSSSNTVVSYICASKAVSTAQPEAK